MDQALHDRMENIEARVRVMSVEPADIPKLLHRAADEIEQLRAEHRAMKEQRDSWYQIAMLHRRYAEYYRGLILAVKRMVNIVQ